MCSRMREMKLSTVAKRNQFSIRRPPFDLWHSLVEAGAVLTHRVPRKFFKGFTMEKSKAILTPEQILALV